VPIAPTFNNDSDVTIAVNLGGSVEMMKPVVGKKKSMEPNSPQIHQKIVDFIGQLTDFTVNSDDSDWGAYDIANEAFDAMQSTIARQKLAAYPPDIVIEIARNACGTLEFDRADEMIEMGRLKTRQCLSKMA